MPQKRRFTPVNVATEFWNAIPDKSPEKCWPWLGATPGHYGALRVEGRKTVGAHRVAWELHNGRSIPQGMCVCHHCDNRPCVNPSHLFLGTHGDNMADKVSKGRSIGPRGEKSGHHKLTLSQVHQLREEYVHERGCIARLARKYKISDGEVGYILSGRSWLLPRHPKYIPQRRTVSREEVMEIRSVTAARSMTQHALATKMGIGKNLLNEIATGKKYSHVI